MASAKGRFNISDFYSGVRHILFAAAGLAVAGAIEVVQAGELDPKVIAQAVVGAISAGALRWLWRWRVKIPTTDEALEKNRYG